MLKELSALDELHNEVDPVCLLEDIVHTKDEGVINLVQDEFFNLERLDGFMLYHHIFANWFHGVELLVALALDQINFTEGAATNQAQNLKVVPGTHSEAVSAVKHRSPAITGSFDFVLGNFRIEGAFYLSLIVHKALA